VRPIRIVFVAIVAALLVGEGALAASPGYHGGSGSSGYRGGSGYSGYHGGYGYGYRGGYGYYGYRGGYGYYGYRGGLYFGLGWPWWGWPGYYPYAYGYGYPYAYAPYYGSYGYPDADPPYAEGGPGPQAYGENQAPAASAPPAQAYWYYCRDSQTYYPYVRSCNGPWEPVLPQPPGQR
jgi:hypothetical protein